MFGQHRPRFFAKSSLLTRVDATRLRSNPADGPNFCSKPASRSSRLLTRADATSLCSNEAGTATLEVAIMLPLYVFLIIALLFFSRVHQMNLRVLKNVVFFSQMPGEQDADDLPTELSANDGGPFPQLTSEPVIEDNVSSNLYETDDILGMFNENTYRVTGSYRFDGEEVVYTTNVRDTPWTRTIKRYDLRDLTQELENEMALQLERTQTRISLDMDLPFVQDAQGQTVIDHHNSNPAQVTIAHEHRDMIRIKRDDGVFIQRHTHLDRLNSPHDFNTWALERLSRGEEGRDFSPNESWSSFYESDVPEGLEP